jgi:hypothetical protein
MVGNGGSNGFVRYDVMQVPVNKYGFAVATRWLSQSTGILTRTTAMTGVLPTGPTPFKTQKLRKTLGIEL